MTLNWPEDQPILDGETIILRPWRPEDAQAVFEACQDEMVQAFTSVPSPYRLTDAEAFVALGPQIWRKRTDVNCAITDDEDAVIGAGERLVVIPRLTLLAAKAHIPDA